MSTLKVNAIRQTGASSDAITLVSDGTCTAKVTNNLSNRNLMINGAMNIAQRGTSDTSDTQGYTTVDRWTVVWNGLENVLNRYQESLSSSDTGPWEKGFRKAWKIENGDQTGGADAGGYINPQYTVEAHDLASSGWNPADPNSKLTLSFWVKSSVAQTFYGYLYTADGTAQAYSFSYALSANTWTKVEKIIPGNANITINNDTGDGFRIYLPLFLGTDRTASGNTLNTWAAYSSSSRTPDQTTTWYTTNDATWHMTGIQLEVGSVATPFEHRSFGEELSRCERYYWHKNVTSGNAGWSYSMAGLDMAITVTTHFPVTMRASPTATIGSSNFRDSSNNVETPNINDLSTKAHWYGIKKQGGGDEKYGFTIDDIKYDAEL